MGYSERWCHLCSVSFNVARIRTAGLTDLHGPLRRTSANASILQTSHKRRLGITMVMATSRRKATLADVAPEAVRPMNTKNLIILRAKNVASTSPALTVRIAVGILVPELTWRR